MKAGDAATMSRCLASEDLETFARFALDDNSIHASEEQGFFGRRIAPGFLTAAIISGTLTKLLGDGNLMLEVGQLKFLSPTFVGDVLECRAVARDVNRRGEALVDVVVSSPRGPAVTGTVRCLQPHREKR